MFEVGSHIRVHRRTQWLGIPYWHHGIATGRDEVIEFGGGALWSKHTTRVRRTTLQAFSQGSLPESVKHPITWFGLKYSPILPPDQVVNRAEWLLCNQPPTYRLGYRNCESVAIWCASGDFESFQVKQFLWYENFLGLVSIGILRKYPKVARTLGLVDITLKMLTAVPITFDRKFFDHARQYPGIDHWAKPQDSQ